MKNESLWKMMSRARFWRYAYALTDAFGCGALGSRFLALHKMLASGDYIWPETVAEWTHNQRVLDVGCGMNFQGLAFLLLGSKSYCGCDPGLRLDKDKMKRHFGKERVPSGYTLGRLMKLFPGLHYHRGLCGDMTDKGPFDVALLHNVTEHVPDLDAVFFEVHKTLKPRGKIIFRHHNFGAWNGHHCPPKDVTHIQRDDPGQQQVLDWAHLGFQPPADHYISRGLNRLRLDRVREITDRYFRVEVWKETTSSEREGCSRITPEILAAHPIFSERDLLTQSVFCVAIRRHHLGEKGAP